MILPEKQSSARTIPVALKRSIQSIIWCVGTAAALAVTHVIPLFAWGERGHYLTGQAAAAKIPAAMPAFFRAAAAQLAYLNPEPDRWRDRTESAIDPALDAGSAPDHFVDMDIVPPAIFAAAFTAPQRYAYADTLRAAGVDPAKFGFLPFRILELTERLRVDFRLWRAAPNDQTRAWIEARIVNDAGILGHYVADGSNPAHTSVNFNGWTGDNPHGYATDKRFHSRFEAAYVQTHITIADLLPGIDSTPHAVPIGQLRPAILAYLRRSNSEVEHLYALDKQAPFDAQTTAPENKHFAAERLAAGAQMLRDLWWTAWVTSAPSDTSAPAIPVRSGSPVPPAGAPAKVP
ncbi:MAG: nuclease [Gemmatimonadaceae bacterium]